MKLLYGGHILVKFQQNVLRKQIVYLDETCGYKNYNPKNLGRDHLPAVLLIAYHLEKDIYVIVHAGQENGFVPNALLVFSTKSKSPDYSLWHEFTEF